MVPGGLRSCSIYMLLRSLHSTFADNDEFWAILSVCKIDEILQTDGITSSQVRRPWALMAVGVSSQGRHFLHIVCKIDNSLRLPVLQTRSLGL